jgi:AmmeMemoRadiSam system protein B
MATVRAPAFAGTFYPEDPRELQSQINVLLAAADTGNDAPKAIIAPHAGYIYSGPVAASVYARLQPGRAKIRRVVLLGPSHRIGFRGVAASRAAAFETPLGKLPVDTAALAQILDLPDVGWLDRAHAREHSLEVHLPFLQTVLEDFSLVPLVVGEASPETIGRVLETLWGGAETLIVISSDLSHYHDYRTAQQMDNATSQAIIELRFEDIDLHDACGRIPIGGLLWLARQRGLQGEIVDLRNSGDTAGPRDQVVGYGAYAFRE